MDWALSSPNQQNQLIWATPLIDTQGLKDETWAHRRWDIAAYRISSRMPKINEHGADRAYSDCNREVRALVRSLPRIANPGEEQNGNPHGQVEKGIAMPTMSSLGDRSENNHLLRHEAILRHARVRKSVISAPTNYKSFE
jgi:hypothetical protein